MQTNTAKTFVCATCNSDQVQLDAWAAWSVETQSWELAATMQQAHCQNCDGETTLLEKPLSSLEKTATETIPSPSDIAHSPVNYEIILNGSTVYLRSPDPVTALEEYRIAPEDHRDAPHPDYVTIQRRSGDTVEQMTFAELLDAAHTAIRSR